MSEGWGCWGGGSQGLVQHRSHRGRCSPPHVGCSLATRTQWSSGVGLLEEHFYKFEKLSK